MTSNTVTELMNELTRMGVRLEARNGSLRFCPGDIPQVVVDRLRQFKAEILATITSADTIDVDTMAPGASEEDDCVNATLSVSADLFGNPLPEPRCKGQKEPVIETVVEFVEWEVD